MALTYSPSGSLGSGLPKFTLTSVEGQKVASENLIAGAKALVVLFICNHCPYVRAIEDRLIALARDFEKRGARFVGICANEPADYPEDAPAELLKRWREKNYGFPYLIDEDQSVARAFGAVCTPDIFVYDSGGALKYRGRLDDSWRDESKVRRQELREALEAIIQGGSPALQQNPAMGCSIKWKPG